MFQYKKSILAVVAAGLSAATATDMTLPACVQTCLKTNVIDLCIGKDLASCLCPTIGANLAPLTECIKSGCGDSIDMTTLQSYYESTCPPPTSSTEAIETVIITQTTVVPCEPSSISDEITIEPTEATTTEDAPTDITIEPTEATTTEDAPTDITIEPTEATTTEDAPTDITIEPTEATTTDVAPTETTTEVVPPDTTEVVPPCSSDVLPTYTNSTPVVVTSTIVIGSSTSFVTSVIPTVTKPTNNHTGTNPAPSPTETLPVGGAAVLTGTHSGIFAAVVAAAVMFAL